MARCETVQMKRFYIKLRQIAWSDPRIPIEFQLGQPIHVKSIIKGEKHEIARVYNC
jgi:hypothetical protein